MSTEETEGSVFESPTQNTSHLTGSSATLASHTSGEKSSADITVDSGVCSTTTSKSVHADPQGPAAAKTSSASSSEACSVAEAENNSLMPKSEEASRRETRVISQADILCPEEEDVRPTRSTRTKTRQAQNRSSDSDSSVKVQGSVKTQEPAEEPRMTR